MDLTINDIDFETLIKTSPPEYVKFNDDPVALSVASYQRWKKFGSRWSELADQTPTDQDRATANDIRKYYGHQITVQGLKGNGHMSSFRRKLGSFLNGTCDLEKKDIGLIYRLPYFYQEDLDIDYVCEQTVSNTNSDRSDMDTVVREFSLIRSIDRSRRSGDFRDYWLTDQNRYAYCISIKMDNPLLQFFDSFVHKPIKMSSLVKWSRIRGAHRNNHVYGKLVNYRLFNDEQV